MAQRQQVNSLHVQLHVTHVMKKVDDDSPWETLVAWLYSGTVEQRLKSDPYPVGTHKHI